MYLLALDTATPTVSVAVARDGVALATMRLRGDRRHAEQLTPAIARCLDECGITARDLHGVAVGVGPGLFTGLRVGIAAAKTIAFAQRIPVVGIGSLDLVAWPLRFTSRAIAAVVDARRHEVFWAWYETVPGGVHRVSEPCVTRAEELLAEMVARDREVLLAGDGARAYRSVLAGYDHAEFAGVAFDAPSVDALVELGTARMEREEFETATDLAPLYLRRVDAEEFRG